MKRKDFFKGRAAIPGSLAMSRSLKPAELGRLLQTAAGDDEDYFWKLVRDQFILDPDWTYLNFGGLGSSPLPVLKCYDEWSRSEECAPSAAHDEKQWSSVKEKLAAVLGKTCRKEDLGLIDCTTAAINMIINGLSLKKGDEVITSTHEHVALHTGLLNRMQREGIVIRLFEPDRMSGQTNVDRIAALITPRTRLIFISHVTCTTGQRFPDKDIAALARAKGIWYALDGAQAPICVPFDIVEAGPDFYTCSTHKWLMGPKRTGFIYVRKEMLDVLRPLTVGAGSNKGYDIRKMEFTLHPTVQRFEFGTENDALFYDLGQAIDFVTTIGVDRIWKHNHALAERFYAGLKDIPGAEIMSPEEEIYRTAMISFKMKSIEYTKVNQHLGQDKIKVRTVSEGGADCIRVSFHICNHDAEVGKILDPLKKLAG